MFKSDKFETLLVLAGLLFLCLVAVASVQAGVTIQKEPTDEQHAACIETALAELGGEPRECVQRVVMKGHCDDVPMPAPATDQVFEPGAAIYGKAWPGSGEPDTPQPPEPGVEIRSDGIMRTYTDAGELRMVGDDLEQSAMTKVGYKQCWGWVFAKLTPQVIALRALSAPDYVPPLAPDALVYAPDAWP
jgi:hypothetical protein